MWFQDLVSLGQRVYVNMTSPLSAVGVARPAFESSASDGDDDDDDSRGGSDAAAREAAALRAAWESSGAAVSASVRCWKFAGEPILFER